MSKRVVEANYVKALFLVLVVCLGVVLSFEFLDSAPYDCRDDDNDRYTDQSPGSCDASSCGEEGLPCSFGDCNDQNRNIYPGAPEICNGVDDDCDGVVDEDSGCAPDCPGSIDLCPKPDKPNIFVDYYLQNNQCHSNTEFCTAAKECEAGYTCGGVTMLCIFDVFGDEKWEWVIEGLDPDDYCSRPLKTYYRDYDNDGFGNPNQDIQLRLQIEGYVANDLDCDDTNDAINPDTQEVCNDGIDNNCNARTDCFDVFCTTEPACACIDTDGDGYGQNGHADCPYPYEIDCDDTNDAIHPGTGYIYPECIASGTCIDTDGDGYYPNNDTLGCGGLRDCNDNDDEMFPGNTEDPPQGKCDDGKDNDCNGRSDYDDYDGLVGDPACYVDVLGVGLIGGWDANMNESEEFEIMCVLDFLGTGPSGRFLTSVYGYVFDGAINFCTLVNSSTPALYRYSCNAGYLNIAPPGPEPKSVGCTVSTYRSASNNPSEFFNIDVYECVPLSQSAACQYKGREYDCGSADDGCGGIIDCGSCPSGDICDTEAHLCVCQPLNFASACSGKQCGDVNDGCGEMINCGSCDSGYTCDAQNRCLPNNPSGMCEVTGARWDPTRVFSGEEVDLEVFGTYECTSGDEISFEIYKKESGADESIEDLGGSNPNPVGFPSGDTQTSWTTQHHGSEDTSEYYFKVFLNGGSTDFDDEDGSGLLEVTRTNCSSGAILSCSDYTDEVTCNNDPCGMAYLETESGQCAWVDNDDGGQCVFAYGVSGYGTCLKTQVSTDDCSDGIYESTWSGNWRWSASQTKYATEAACLTGEGGTSGECVYDLTENGWYFDPSGLSAACSGGQTIIECPAQIKLPFFNFYTFIATILFISGIYFVLGRKK